MIHLLHAFADIQQNVRNRFGKNFQSAGYRLSGKQADALFLIYHEMNVIGVLSYPEHGRPIQQQPG